MGGWRGDCISGRHVKGGVVEKAVIITVAVARGGRESWGWGVNLG